MARCYVESRGRQAFVSACQALDELSRPERRLARRTEGEMEAGLAQEGG
jgi:alpha-ketoglutarate-dependent taurine dioxygenase